jgi:hypothetical protein
MRETLCRSWVLRHIFCGAALMLSISILPLLLAAATASPFTELLPRQATHEGDLTQCPGYTASNVQQDGAQMIADLKLAGTACNAYGADIEDLRLEVTYDTGTRRPWYNDPESD